MKADITPCSLAKSTVPHRSRTTAPQRHLCASHRQPVVLPGGGTTALSDSGWGEVNSGEEISIFLCCKTRVDNTQGILRPLGMTTSASLHPDPAAGSDRSFITVLGCWTTRYGKVNRSIYTPHPWITTDSLQPSQPGLFLSTLRYGVGRGGFDADKQHCQGFAVHLAP